MRLVLSDVRMRAAMWLWTLGCASVGAACAAGTIIAMVTAVDAAQRAVDEDMVSAYISLGGNIAFFTALAAAGVVSSTVGLTLTTQRHEHALWVILGIPRRRVVRVLRVELLVLGAVAGLVAVPLAPVVATLTLGQWAGIGLLPQQPPVSVQGWHIAAALCAGAAPCLVGGWGATRRAARTPEMQAFRDAAETTTRPGITRMLFALSLLAGVVGTWIPGMALEIEGGTEQRAVFAFAGSLFLICLLLMLGPWVFTPLLRTWTVLVPAKDVAWHLAAKACRARAARSVTTILPFALSLSLVGLFMVMGAVMPGATVALADVLVVLGWVFVVSWTGGLAVIALVGADRRRDAAIVELAGARPGVIARSTVYEGLIYAGTALVFGALTLVLSVVSISAGARVSAVEVFARLPWDILGWLAALTVALPCLALIVQAALAAHVVPARVLRG
ncbi:FtsX-like permease family protein [Microbacterium istanbulense]|uniref:FtsX-like permease family protein n=1 Tax=Microbacterium istanbulense TaxID=3122049 RepID=A0ABU8LI79_9MICO